MRSVWRTVLAALVVLVLSVGVRAQETPVDSLLKLIKGHRYRAAMELLQSPPMKPYLEADAKEARRVGLALDDASYKLAKTDRPAAEKTVSRFREIAAAVVAAFPDDSDAHIAEAHGHAALGTLNDFGKKRDEDVDPEPWAAAAASYMKAFENAPGDVSVLAHSAKFLAFAASATASRAGEFRDESLARANRALEADSKSFDVRDSVSRTYLLVAESFLPSDPKLAKAPLVLAADVSGALYDSAAKDKKRSVGTTYNTCVTLNLEHGLKLKLDYRMVAAIPGAGIRCKVPDSFMWVVDGGVTQRDSSSLRGRNSFRDRRSMSFASYDWDTAWQFGFAGEAGGDNMKGLGKCIAATSATEFNKVKKQRIGKGRIGKGAEKGVTVKITGTGASGNEKRFRAFLWKNKDAMTTLCVEVNDEADVPETDPEFEAFRNSFGGK